MQCLDPSYYLLCCAGSMGCCFCVYLLMCHTSPCAVPVNKNKRCTNLQKNILKPKWRDKLAWVCRKCANISTCMLHVIVLSKSMQQKYFLFCFEFDLLMVQPRLACDVIHMAATHAGSLCRIRYEWRPQKDWLVMGYTWLPHMLVCWVWLQVWMKTLQVGVLCTETSLYAMKAGLTYEVSR